MGSGILGTNIAAGHGFFGFDPTPNSSLVNTVRQGGPTTTVGPGGFSIQLAPDTNAKAPSTNTGVKAASGSNTSPTVASSSGNYTGGSSAAAQQAAAQAAQNAAYYDGLTNTANNQLGRLGTQESIGNQNIMDAYNHSLNTLLGNKDQTTRDYQTNKDQSLQDYTSTRGSIQAGVGQTANSLQRLLGAHGYTGSANTAANFAAAKTGAEQNNQVQGTYSRNNQALDTNFGDYNNKWNASVDDLNHQRDTQKNGLASQIASNRQSLLQQLSQIAQARTGSAAAGKPYENQINALGGQIDQLGRQYASPVVSAAAPTYQAPTLDKYAYDPTAIQDNSGQPGAADQLNPFLSVLLGGKDKNQLGMGL